MSHFSIAIEKVNWWMSAFPNTCAQDVQEGNITRYRGQRKEEKSEDEILIGI